jgi:hypothetical protein
MPGSDWFGKWQPRTKRESPSILAGRYVEAWTSIVMMMMMMMMMVIDAPYANSYAYSTVGGSVSREKKEFDLVVVVAVVTETTEHPSLPRTAMIALRWRARVASHCQGETATESVPPVSDNDDDDDDDNNNA